MTTFPEEKDTERERRGAAQGHTSGSKLAPQARPPGPIWSLGRSSPVPLAPQLALSSLFSQDSLVSFRDK